MITSRLTEDTELVPTPALATLLVGASRLPGPLSVPPDAPKTLTEALERSAHREGHKGLIPGFISAAPQAALEDRPLHGPTRSNVRVGFSKSVLTAS